MLLILLIVANDAGGPPLFGVRIPKPDMRPHQLEGELLQVPPQCLVADSPLASCQSLHTRTQLLVML